MNFPPLQPHVLELSYSISGVSKDLKITILNKSGSKANYAVFSGKPTIKSRPSKDIRQYYLDAAYGVDYTYGRAEFNLSKQKYCVCGSLDGSPEATVNAPLRATALSQMPIVLGYKKPDGTLITGTTCNVIANPGDSPSFSHDRVAPRGEDGAFCIQNDSQFTLPTAKDGNFFEGYGLLTALDNSSDSRVMLAATVLPNPGISIQITPTNTYYVVQDDVKIGSSVAEGTENRACEVDFVKLGSDHAIVKHGSDGSLVLQV